MSHRVRISVNGKAEELDVESRLLLCHLLRDRLRLTGTNVGCDTSQCGSCTVMMDGKAVKSCTILAVQADGSEVTTIEGLAGETDSIRCSSLSGTTTVSSAASAHPE